MQWSAITTNGELPYISDTFYQCVEDGFSNTSLPTNNLLLRVYTRWNRH